MLVLGQLELAVQVRLDVIGRPQPLHTRLRDARGGSHGAAAPAPQMRRRLTDRLQHPPHLRLREPGLAPSSGRIRQPRQAPLPIAPAPLPDGRPRGAQLRGDGLLIQSFNSQQNDSGALPIPNCHRVRTHSTLQLLRLFWQYLQGHPPHGSRLPVPVLPVWHQSGISKGICETLH